MSGFAFFKISFHFKKFFADLLHSMRQNGGVFGDIVPDFKWRIHTFLGVRIQVNIFTLGR